MANIKYRASSTETAPASTTVKGSPLTWLEGDANTKALNDDIQTRALKGANSDITSMSGLTGIGNTAATHIQISTGGAVTIPSTLTTTATQVANGGVIVAGTATPGVGQGAIGVTGNYLQLVGGTVGLALNNHANTVSNLLITDAGAVSIPSTLTSSDHTVARAGALTTGYIYYGNTGTKYAGFDGTNFVTSMPMNFSILGNAATATNVAYTGLTGTVPTWNQNTTGSAALLVGQPRRVDLADFTTWDAAKVGPVGWYGFAGGPDAGTYHFGWRTAMFDTNYGAEIAIRHDVDSIYFRRYMAGYVAWKEILHAGNYNTYSPTLTGTGASGTWSITAASITGQANSATITASITAGSASTIVLREALGYINSNYFNSTDNSSTSGVTGVMVKQGDNYLRTGTAAAIATFLSGTNLYSPVVREKLTAARTYYVAATGGSDANNGLAVGTPFATIQKAINVAAGLDLDIYNVGIQLANGTYSTSQSLVPYTTAGGSISIVGNSTTPSAVLINPAGMGFVANSPVGYWILNGMKLNCTGGSGYGILANSPGVIINMASMDFGVCGSYHILGQTGSYAAITGAYTISGGAAAHAVSNMNAVVYIAGSTVTLTGTPGFSAFAIAATGGVLMANASSYTGAATGSRYSASMNGVIYAGTASTTYFPGNAVGTQATGGQYGV